MFAAGAGVAIGSAEKNGAHGFDVASFFQERQWKMNAIKSFVDRE